LSLLTDDSHSGEKTSCVDTELLTAAQQYLQARRENRKPSSRLGGAWESFYRPYDPVVQRTINGCQNSRCD
jgi:hypothetical protein